MQITTCDPAPALSLAPLGIGAVAMEPRLKITLGDSLRNTSNVRKGAAWYEGTGKGMLEVVRELFVTQLLSLSFCSVKMFFLCTLRFDVCW